jgi:hypothetical protein
LISSNGTEKEKSKMHAINRGLVFLVAVTIALGTMQSRADAAPLDAGDLVISEVMANPAMVTDGNGEWFELYNTTGSTIDLDGLILSDDGTDSHTISGTLEVASGGYLVLGNNDDFDTNGGYVADYVYSGFLLGNSGDEIVISEVIDEVETEIARLNYTLGSGFVVSGKSRELSDVGTYPYSESDFVEAVSPYGDGDLGTPGAPIPEPSTGLLVAMGLLGLAVMGRRQGLR